MEPRAAVGQGSAADRPVGREGGSGKGEGRTAGLGCEGDEKEVTPGMSNPGMDAFPSHSSNWLAPFVSSCAS